ncbi:hypothetical protein PR048_001880 [Dryococelus australis]|uniref:Uncharacterized protein n=1 Tax=Dryococelus australis TaxID=614101 RepID=A0ABQ9IIQ2_9NEOP|nr:hypothetical protein PR048_001880 [Dryococelus australis]
MFPSRDYSKHALSMRSYPMVFAYAYLMSQHTLFKCDAIRYSVLSTIVYDVIAGPSVRNISASSSSSIYTPSSIGKPNGFGKLLFREEAEWAIEKLECIVEGFWAARIIEVLRADEAEVRLVCSSARMQGRGKREFPEKTPRPVASFGTVPRLRCDDDLLTSPPIKVITQLRLRRVKEAGWGKRQEKGRETRVFIEVGSVSSVVRGTPCAQISNDSSCVETRYLRVLRFESSEPSYILLAAKRCWDVAIACARFQLTNENSDGRQTDATDGCEPTFRSDITYRSDSRATRQNACQSQGIMNGSVKYENGTSSQWRRDNSRIVRLDDVLQPPISRQLGSSSQRWNTPTLKTLSQKWLGSNGEVVTPLASHRREEGFDSRRGRPPNLGKRSPAKRRFHELLTMEAILLEWRVERYGGLLTLRSSEPMRVIEVSMEQSRNEGAGESGHPPEKNPPINGILRFPPQPRYRQPGAKPAISLIQQRASEISRLREVKCQRDRFPRRPTSTLGCLDCDYIQGDLLFNTTKLGSGKDDSALRIKRAIAATRRALKLHAIFSLCFVHEQVVVSFGLTCLLAHDKATPSIFLNARCHVCTGNIKIKALRSTVDNAVAVQSHFMTVPGGDVYLANLCNAHSMGYGSRRPTRVLVLTAQHRAQRLTWVREITHWILENWKHVACCQQGTVQASGGSVMVWGVFTWYGLDLLVRVPKNLNGNCCKTILSGHLQPFMDFSFNDYEGMFPRHEPNPALWDVVERAIRTQDPAPRNTRKLWAAIHKAWLNISLEVFRPLVESMPRQVTAPAKVKIPLPPPLNPDHSNISGDREANSGFHFRKVSIVCLVCTLHAARREYCTPAQSLVRSDDTALVMYGNAAPIAPPLLSIKSRKYIQKAMRRIAKIILHKAAEHTTCTQVDTKQGFQKCQFYREQPIRIVICIFLGLRLAQLVNNRSSFGAPGSNPGREFPDRVGVRFMCYGVGVFSRLSCFPPPASFRCVCYLYSEVSMEQSWNEKVGETGDTRENPPASGIDWHDSNMRKFGGDSGGKQTRFA